jgi:hypothetical protein
MNENKIYSDIVSQMKILDTVSTKEVRKVVMDGRKMKVLPAQVWQSLPWEPVRLLLHQIGVYVIPTEELLDYLDELIGQEKTIEIGAGMGFIGRELDIPVTDSCQQRDDKATVKLYEVTGQPTIKYPADIIKAEALEAVRRFKPHTVLGCYITHKWRDDTQSGNFKGIDFEELYRRVHRIILVGNKVTHRDNPLMELPHQEIELPGLLTRSDNSLNRIFIWEH